MILNSMASIFFYCFSKNFKTFLIMMKNFTHIQIVINDHWHIYVIVSYIVNSKQLFVPLHWTKLNNKILKLSYLTKQSVYPANQVTEEAKIVIIDAYIILIH